MATALTADQLAQAKAQVAQAKVTAVQAVISDLMSGTTTVAHLKADVALARSALDETDAIFQDVDNLSTLLSLSGNNLTTKLAPLQAAAAAS